MHSCYGAASILTFTLYPSQASWSGQCRVHSISPLAVGGRNIGAEARAAQAAADGVSASIASRRRSRTPQIRRSSRMRRVAALAILWMGRGGCRFQGRGAAACALRLAVALIDRVDAVEDFAVNRRAEQLEVFGVGPDQRARRSRRAGRGAAWCSGSRAHPTPARASSGRRWQSARKSRSVRGCPFPAASS
jgi:hypothetical protein